ncbi:MAG: homoserine kinase [Planctomycetota bacterium]|nr:MAG: homoserine kinase [Planctomycetota bacterium]
MRWRIVAPASIANLGPGFDTLAAAVDLATILEAERAAHFELQLAGEGVDRLPAGRTNLLARGYEAVAAALGAEPPPARLRCLSRIPLARGLGSSAAALVAGGLAACAMLGVQPDPMRLLGVLAPLEGHADNLAACLLGGLAVAWIDAESTARARRLPCPAPPPLALVIPEFEGETARARAVLPAAVPRADAVHNLQRLSLLLLALSSGSHAELGAALADRLHEPYRVALYPGLEAVRAAAPAHGALGTCLAGAGPSLLAIPRPGVDAAVLARALAACWREQGVAARALAASIAERGAHLQPA